jgi:hypothetical protein
MTHKNWLRFLGRLKVECGTNASPDSCESFIRRSHNAEGLSLSFSLLTTVACRAKPNYLNYPSFIHRGRNGSHNSASNECATARKAILIIPSLHFNLKTIAVSGEKSISISRSNNRHKFLSQLPHFTLSMFI